MKAAIAALEKELEAAGDDQDKKAELRKAIDSLKRQRDVTDKSERPDYRDPNFKQVANSTEEGEEIGNAIARTNREQGDEVGQTQVPRQHERTQPPVEAGNIQVESNQDGTARKVTVKDDTGQPSIAGSEKKKQDAQK